ncbi:unnamed protein product [Psylliodes chrysocephalus]|uniref:GH16 domain-containing protein n=1 Tax=Psylliodes chrysocephalus TaxID=3402493 RepID=A0A9P0CL66_9CUCU|nr:unnamed protein product [Psylliodes chrysocephala]
MTIKIIVYFLILSVLYLESLSDCECQESITSVSGRYSPKRKICSGDLIFEENFDLLRLDIWKHEQTLGGGSGNNQFQWYTNNRSNTYVEDGILHIRPTLLADERGEDFLYNGTIDINGDKPTDSCTNSRYDGCVRTGTKDIILNPIKSARMHTAESFAFKFGKVEARAKAPIGDWLWPAIWMMPRWNKYSSWPASGEIDIMESRGNRQFFKNKINIGVEQVSSTLHWGPNANYNRYNYTTFQKNDDNPNGWHQDFHRYQLEWRPENISFLIDDEYVGTVTPPEGGFWELGQLNATGLENPWKHGTKMAPFDDEFYFILNVAIGGTSFFSDMAENKPNHKPWKNFDGRASMTEFWKAKEQWLPTWDVKSDDSHMQVDYIKVTAL